MRPRFVVALVLVGIAIAVLYYLAGCSSDSGTQAQHDCHATSDSTMVCGDTNFQLY
jgi:hypothetical protein